MENVGWSDTMALGIPDLDREHEALVSRFLALTDPGQAMDAQAFRSCIDELVGEVCAHFDHEEQLMREHHFPEASEHKEAHDDMLKQINSFLILLDSEPDHPGMTVLDFVGRWLMDHIAEDDRTFGTFLRRVRRSKGSGQTNCFAGDVTATS